MESSRRHDVDIAAEDVVEREAKSGEVEQRPAFLKLHEEINVAVGLFLAPGNRSEDRGVQDAMGLQGLSDPTADLSNSSGHGLSLHRRSADAPFPITNLRFVACRSEAEAMPRRGRGDAQLRPERDTGRHVNTARLRPSTWIDGIRPS